MNTSLVLFLIQSIGYLLTFAIMAVAFFIAFRRTSLRGFYTLFLFAVGSFVLWVLTYATETVVSHAISIDATRNVALGSGLLSVLLYAVGVSGLLSILSRKSRDA
jgi:hypothetical protein